MYQGIERAISIRQPWAWLIVNGIKTVENRTWRTSHRGPLLIHAGQTMAFGQQDYADFLLVMHDEAGIILPDYANIQRGGIVGSVNLVDCVTTCKDPIDADWHEPGCYAFILRDAKTLLFLPMPGKLSIFKI